MKITQITILLVVPFLMLACGGKKTTDEQTNQEIQVSTHEMTDSETEDNVMYYTCPMESHKHIHSNKAGKCDECGMALVAVVGSDESNMDFYGCPMPVHSHVRSDQPGKCSECGMDLMPMRLKKS